MADGGSFEDEFAALRAELAALVPPGGLPDQTPEEEAAHAQFLRQLLEELEAPRDQWESCGVPKGDAPQPGDPAQQGLPPPHGHPPQLGAPDHQGDAEQQREPVHEGGSGQGTEDPEHATAARSGQGTEEASRALPEQPRAAMQSPQHWTARLSSIKLPENTAAGSGQGTEEASTSRAVPEQRRAAKQPLKPRTAMLSSIIGKAANLVNPGHVDPTVESDSSQEREAPTRTSRGVALQWPETPKYPAHVPAVRQAHAATRKPVKTRAPLGDRKHWPNGWWCTVGRKAQQVYLSHVDMLQTWLPVARALASEAGLPADLADMSGWQPKLSAKKEGEGGFEVHFELPESWPPLCDVVPGETHKRVRTKAVLWLYLFGVKRFLDVGGDFFPTGSLEYTAAKISRTRARASTTQDPEPVQVDSSTDCEVVGAAAPGSPVQPRAQDDDRQPPVEGGCLAPPVQEGSPAPQQPAHQDARTGITRFHKRVVTLPSIAHVPPPSPRGLAVQPPVNEEQDATQIPFQPHLQPGGPDPADAARVRMEQFRWDPTTADKRWQSKWPLDELVDRRIPFQPHLQPGGPDPAVAARVRRWQRRVKPTTADERIQRMHG